MKSFSSNQTKMESGKLFFATNRNHEGGNRWKPESYGQKFSTNGRHNLRFGEVDFNYEEAEVKKHLDKGFDGERSGDGEKLSACIQKNYTSSFQISAYPDESGARAEGSDDLASNKMFINLQRIMKESADVVIFIHGYNVSWDAAVSSAISLQFMLNRKRSDSDKQVMVVLFSWPSDGSMMPFTAYKSDRDDARDSAEAIGRGILKLRDYLAKLKRKPTQEDDAIHTDEEACNQDIHLLCHSMGNFVLQNALPKIIEYSHGQKMPRIFKNIFMCAADVDEDVLEPGQPLERLDELCTYISVYHNKGDLAMYISDYTKSNPDRLGHSGSAHPNLLHNKIHQVNCSAIVSGPVEHSYYLWATVNDDIRQSIDDVEFDNFSRRKRKQLANSREWALL